MEVDSVHHQANYASYSISQVMCQFTIGVKNSFKHHFSFNKINPNSGYGFPKMYSHEQINAKEVQFNNIQQLSDKHTPEGSGRRWRPRHQSNYNIQGKGGRNSKDCLLPSLRPLTVQCLLWKRWSRDCPFRVSWSKCCKKGRNEGLWTLTLLNESNITHF